MGVENLFIWRYQRNRTRKPNWAVIRWRNSWPQVYIRVSYTYKRERPYDVAGILLKLAEDEAGHAGILQCPIPC